MEFLLIWLSIVFVILIIIGAIILVIYSKLKKSVKSLGLSESELVSMIKDGESDAITRHKSISGMSSLIIPRIVRDFPNFSESELYRKVETSLLAIFNSLENEVVLNKVELNVIKNNLELTIEDMKNSNISKTFKDIKFHNHAIKSYKKSDGVLMISVATSLEYFYKEKKNDEIISDYSDYKKQTVYETKFIYVYDPEKYESTKNLIGIHCPNCGSPVKNLSNKHCAYCGSGLEDINLKSWFISEYKEK